MQGARVFLKATPPEVSTWANATVRKIWINEHIDSALRTHADATNFDFEGPLLVRFKGFLGFRV